MWQRGVVQIIITPSAAEAASTAAAWMARRMRSAVRLRSVCRVAVSGGATPALMFDALAAMDLPWNAIHLFQVDERVAPDGDADRNATQLVDHLIRHVTIRQANVHLMPVTAASLSRAASRYAEAMGDDPLDIVHLGLGDDGHTASWAPGDPVIDNAAAVAMSGKYRGRARMTMTPSVVNAARARLLLASGQSKAAPLAAWVDEHAPLPVERVRRTDTTLVLDAEVSSLLRSSADR